MDRGRTVRRRPGGRLGDGTGGPALVDDTGPDGPLDIRVTGATIS